MTKEKFLTSHFATMFTILESIVAHNEQFLLLLQCSQLLFLFTEIFSHFAKMLSKSSVADLLYVGEG